MKLAVIGHTGTVGKAIYEYYRVMGADVSGWSLDAPEWDWRGADFAFVCVPTPHTNPVALVREAIARIHDDPIIIIKSTVPPGTTDLIQRENPGKRICFSPEFLTARRAAHDWRFPERHIVGYTKETFAWVDDVFAILPPEGIFTHTPRRMALPAVEAEILKYIHNLYGAMQIIFANHWHDICETVGADWERVREAAPTSVLPRMAVETYWNVWHDGKRGYQGACFPKDTETLLQWAKAAGVQTELFAATQAANLRILEAQGLDDGIERTPGAREGCDPGHPCGCCG